MEKLTIEQINTRINNEFCEKTKNSLTDKTLKNKYKKSSVVKKRIKDITCIMGEIGIDENQIKKFLELYDEKIIPPGIKGLICGNKFNEIIKNKLKNLNLDKERFSIKFEKHNPNVKTDERPDWYIQDNKKRKIIIGMNQMDLWGGGAQLNRGSKYLIDNKVNTGKTKMLSVVCNKIKIYRKNTKIHNLLNAGFKNDTLCYINNLENIIFKYFN